MWSISLAGLLVATPTGPAWSWETAHGKPDNSGFVDVATTKASAPSRVLDVGSIAVGAGAIVAPDGTVFLGNQQGKLMSFKPDGTPGWSRVLGSGQSIPASPAIGSDGMIYVIGVEQGTDHRTNPPTRIARAALHRFTSGGGYLGKIPFPEHNGDGVTSAWPSLWRFNGTELVVIPAIYRRAVGGGVDIRLLAFNPSGGLVADHLATSITPQVTGGTNAPSWAVPFCLIPPVNLMCIADTSFTPAVAMQPAPFPGVGIFTNPNGGTPFILMTDGNKVGIGLTFSGGKFNEHFRVSEKDRYLFSAPAFLADGRSVFGFQDVYRQENGTESGGEGGGVLFSGPNLTATPRLKTASQVLATPTRLPNGATLVLAAQGDMTMLSGAQAGARGNASGASNASAAASRTHVFVSTGSAFKTFDPATLKQVETMSWTGGGKNPPVIGPLGHVYAIADGRLFVFTPGAAVPSVVGSGGPAAPLGGGVMQGVGIPASPAPGKPGAGVFQDSGIPVPQTQSQSPSQNGSYKPPMSKNGYRLFACLELDGDDCGKGDHREIAKAYCVKEGYSAVKDYDVDTRKVKAETIEGDAFCSKNKCKVFDEIVCKM